MINFLYKKNETIKSNRITALFERISPVIKFLIFFVVSVLLKPKNFIGKIFQKLIISYILIFVLLGVIPSQWTKNINSFLEKSMVLRPIARIFKLENSKSEIVDLDMLSVKSLLVQPEKKTPIISALGSIEYFEKVDIVSKTSGSIQKIYVKEGEVIHKGQLLVQMETLQLELEQKKNRSQYESAVSTLKLAEEKYEKAKNAVEIREIEVEKRKTQVKELKAELDKIRTTYYGKQALFREHGVSKEEYENTKTAVVAAEAKFLLSKKDLDISQVGFRDEDLKIRGLAIPKEPEKKAKAFVLLNTRIEKAEVDVAVSQVNSAKAALDSTDELLRTTSIRSPIDGIVAFRNKHVGEFVNQGSVTSSEHAIMVLVNISSVYAKLNLKESELKILKKGMSLDFSVDVFPEEKFQGSITVINPIIDPKTHTAEIKALLKNPAMKLKPGMFLRGTVTTGKPEFVILLPSTAISPKEGDNAWVFTIKESLVLKSEVKTGRHFDDKIEIKSGLEVGDIVATEKLSQLKEGTKVKPVLPKSE